MLNFAKRLLKSRNESDCESDTSLQECDFFVLEGDRWCSLSDGKCVVEFKSAPKTGYSLTIKCERESVSETFELETILNLTRFIDEDGNHCFQWIIKKGKSGDNLDEFGIRFETEAAASEFALQVSTLGQQSATIIGEFSDGVELVERSSDDKWERIEKDVIVLISKTKRGDHFLTIQSSKNDVLFNSLISEALQFNLAHPPFIAFLGITPLSEDIRVLGLECEGSFKDLTECLLSIPGIRLLPAKARRNAEPPSKAAPVIESSSSSESDVEMWEPDEDEKPIKKRAAVSRRRRPPATESDSYNRFLETGHKDESMAVVISRLSKGGTGFQVFNTERGGSKPAPISSMTKLGSMIDPSAVMMHEGDSKCLLLDPSLGRDKVFELDLERGKIVNEWTPGTGINKMMPVSKQSQRGGEKTFLGMNERSIFAIDPRIKPNEHTGNKVYSFTYATNVKLSTAATDREGHIVAGNRSGQLRLFDGQTNKEGELKRAKTFLSNLSTSEVPITHVDVTSDGNWIIATCATFLMLVSTDGGNGFSKSISSSSSPPIILSLSSSDIAKHGLTAIQFTGAKFDEPRGLIVTSTGSLAILWDFAKATWGRTNAYSIKLMKDFIVDIGNVGGRYSSSVVAMYEDRLELAHVAPKRLN